DSLGVGEADDDEQNVGELHCDGAFGLLRSLAFLAELVVQLPRQLADFLGEPREVRQRREVSFLILTDPPIHGLLGFAQGHRRLRAIVNAELPPLVAPFRGERYAGGDRLSALIAPPYDVISREDRARYAALDPHNIVHLILPEAPSGGGGDRYAHAAALLAQWRASGVVQPDAGDSVYVVAQDYALPSGERRTRSGMFAAVRAAAGEAATELARLAGQDRLYIADGHHRYETAVAYAREYPGADRVLSFIVSARDPGLTILPTHRIVFGTGRDPAKLVAGWREWFEV